MGAHGFQHEIEIAVSPPKLREFLLDLHNHVPLHPLIESIKDLPSDPKMPGARRYEVVDRVPVGPFCIRAVYVAALEDVSENEVRGHAWQKPGVRLVTAYRLREADLGCHLAETVSVRAPFFLRRFVTRQASEAHAASLRSMKRWLEDGQRA